MVAKQPRRDTGLGERLDRYGSSSAAAPPSEQGNRKGPGRGRIPQLVGDSDRRILEAEVSLWRAQAVGGFDPLGDQLREEPDKMARAPVMLGRLRKSS